MTIRDDEPKVVKTVTDNGRCFQLLKIGDQDVIYITTFYGGGK